MLFNPGRFAGSVVAWLLPIILAGCVLTDTPLGEKPVNLTGQEAEWEGTWADSEHDHAMRIRVIDARDGILQAGDVADTSSPPEPGRSIRLQIRQTGKRLYANFKLDSLTPAPPPGFGQYLMPAQVEMRNDHLTIWMMDHKVVGGLVQSGKLPGHVDLGNGIVIFTRPDPVRLAKLERGEKLYGLSQPFLMYQKSAQVPTRPRPPAPEPQFGEDDLAPRPWVGP
jgi:hypothetical protein